MIQVRSVLSSTILPAGSVQSFSRLTLTGASLVSTPTLNLTGAWFTGGSTTTTKPHVLIEPSGTTSTGWSTSGTGLGINAAAGFAGNYLDCQLNGVSVVRIGVQTGASANANFLRVAGSFATVATAAQNAVQINLTSAGSSAFAQRGININIAAGYSGSSAVHGITIVNGAASTAALGWGAGLANQITTNGNFGIDSDVFNTTTGHNAGIGGTAGGSSTSNVGGIFVAPFNANAAPLNVGVVGQAGNATTLNVGGYFAIQNVVPYPNTVPVMVASAACIADGFGDVIFLGQASGVEKFRIAATGTAITQNTFRMKGFTVATLPAGAAVAVGDIAYVTDALAPAFLAIVVGGGAVVSPVFFDGANWVAM